MSGIGCPGRWSARNDRTTRVPWWAAFLGPIVLGIIIPFWGVLLAPPLLAVIFAFRKQPAPTR